MRCCIPLSMAILLGLASTQLWAQGQGQAGEQAGQAQAGGSGRAVQFEGLPDFEAIDRTGGAGGVNPRQGGVDNLRQGPLGGGQGGAGGAAARGFQGGGRGGAGGRQNANRLQQNQTRAQYVTRISFPVVPGRPPLVAQKASVMGIQRIQTAIRSMQFASGVTAAYDGDTLVLRGAVASNHARRVAERMAKMEPGVRTVRNDLRVSVTQ